MKQLIIVDLNFCEIELSSDREVKGGGSPYGSWSADYDYKSSWGYQASKTGGIKAYAEGSVAGAVAGAAADGSTYTSAYART